MSFVYQIYPISFFDSNSDGIGDLPGIIQKLDYIASLGVDYVWITPIFKSPMNDNGYDVENYYEINEIFGTKQDLINLVNQAKKLNLKIMLDMVFNHTSTNHKWFKLFLQNDEKYRDFYIWKESVDVPNNWQSKFGGSCWTKFAPNKWYLHLFDQTQADLNWDNPELRNEMKKVIKHYIELGVKGFRFDVINLISKSSYENDYIGDGRKFYTNGPNVHKYVKELAILFKNQAEFLSVGELSSTSVEDAQKFANYKKDELDSVFTFHHLKIDYDKSNDKFIYCSPNIKKLYELLKFWQEKMQETNSTLANFFNNHDQPRSVSRFIDKKHHVEGAKMLFALTTCLNGITYIYQGEEIAMQNPDFEDKLKYRDVETLNYFDKHNYLKATKGIMQKSRDNARTPMQWNNLEYSGFSNHKPWIDVSNSYKQINVLNQEQDPSSVLNFYKNLIQFYKANEVLQFGKIKFNLYIENIISFKKIWKEQEYECIFSFSNKVEQHNWTGNVLNTNTNIKQNRLQPYQFLILKIK